MRISVSGLLNVVFLTILVASLFFMAGRSQIVSTPKYDPLLDVNDDGVINIIDLVRIASGEHWHTTGEPMNKSEFVHQGCVNSPWWDSGWVTCMDGYNTYYFNKTLTTTDVFVYMIGKNSTYGFPHQIDYGGERNGAYSWGVHWQDLTSMSITLNRHGNDQNWNYVRIMIWKISDP